MIKWRNVAVVAEVLFLVFMIIASYSFCIKRYNALTGLEAQVRLLQSESALYRVQIEKLQQDVATGKKSCNCWAYIPVDK